MKAKKYSLKELADFLEAKLQGDPNYEITGIAALDKAVLGQISFLENSNYRQYLKTTRASAVILREDELNDVVCNALVVTDPYLAYAKLTSLYIEENSNQNSGIHPTVIYGKNCNIDSTVNIGAYTVIGDRVKISAYANIGPGCVIGNDVEIGTETKLCARVTLYGDVKIGDRSLIHSGAVIGSDGFGMANDNGKWRKIYQLGNVRVGNDVEIGANTTIDRGALDDTVIEDGVKLDNLIQIGHNTQIGAHTAIAGCTGIAGSTIIGEHCLIAGGVGIAGHLKIANGVILTAMSGVERSIEEPGIYASGIPAMPHRSWWRVLVRLTQLDSIVKRIQKIEKHLGRE